MSICFKKNRISIISAQHSSSFANCYYDHCVAPTNIVPASSFANCYYDHCVALTDIVPASSFSTCYYDHVWGGDTNRDALDFFTLAKDLVVGFRAPHFLCVAGAASGRAGGRAITEQPEH